MFSWEWLSDHKAWIEPIRGLIATSIFIWLLKIIFERAKRFLPKGFYQPKIRLHSISKEDLDRINKIYKNLVRAYGPYTNQPIINENGHWQLTPTQEAIAQQFYHFFKENNIPNDPHAAIVDALNPQDDPVVLNVKIMDYSTLKALRSESNATQWPHILSASALIVDSKNETIILHRRSEKSATYANYLHTIGGAYWPAMNGRDGDRASVLRTAQREALEEISTYLTIHKTTPLFLLEELETNFVQFVFLGCPPNDTCTLQSNAEGSFSTIKFNALKDLLLSQKQKIVPTGEAALLLWLAMGAPGTDENTKFSGDSPLQLFLKICAARENY